MKICSKCSQSKPEADFSKKRGGRAEVCKKCHNEYAAGHYRKNKEKYIDRTNAKRQQYKESFYRWLSGKSCVDCGNNNMVVLEFDHVTGEKSYNISNKIGQVPLESMMEEIGKCEIVCANCHRIRTAGRGNWMKASNS